jgi:alcohol dehydrogenase class IV
MQFEFATATRIIFGRGRVREAAPLAAKMGRRPLLVTGGDPARAEHLLGQLKLQGLEPVTFSVHGEPETETVVEGRRQAQEAGCDIIIGFGGGSALDAGKAIAAMLANEGDLLDYLEVIGRGRPLDRAAAPYIAIPTTSGTGAEVTRNAVLASSEHRVKVSLRSPLMLARVALVDPELTVSVPPAVTAYTGMDALTQLIEPYVCGRTNPMIDAICREGMRLAARSLHRAFSHGGDLRAREDMALGSLFGGMALANAGLGAVHGLAGPLGGMVHAPHGALCARLLPLVMEMNIRALEERVPSSPALPRYDEVARLLTGETRAVRADGVIWAYKTCTGLSIPPLSVYGLQAADIPAATTQAQKASSMKANPVELTDRELIEILTRALG